MRYANLPRGRDFLCLIFLHKLLIRAGKSIQRKRVNKHQPSFLDKTI